MLLVWGFFLVRNYQRKKPDRNSDIANAACQYKDRRFRLIKDFEISFFCKYDLVFKKFIIKKGIVMIKNGRDYIIPVKDCSKVPKEIKDKYATRHQKRLVVEIPRNYLEETLDCYEKFAKFEVVKV